MKSEFKASCRTSIFIEVEQYLKDRKLTVTDVDSQRPWGGFFVIDEKQITQFINLFFPEEAVPRPFPSVKLSPKILVVEPGKRLSWQYHKRRSEIWRLLRGTVGVATSFIDKESDNVTLLPGQKVRVAQGQRHRLIGLSEWAVLAEIWQHTDTVFPSDESDIVRVQDDFGR